MDGRIAILTPHPDHGPSRPQSIELGRPAVPTVYDLNKSRNRPFAAAFLALWIERESASKYRLLHLFAKEHEVFTFEDHGIIEDLRK